MSLMREASLAQHGWAVQPIHDGGDRGRRAHVGDATMPVPMRGNPTVDHAIVDALHTLLEGTRDVHIVGALSEGARERLARSLSGRLSTAERPDPSHARHETVVVLDTRRLGEAEAVVSPGGTLTVAVVNPRYGSFLVEVVEGGRAPCSESADLDGVCGRLETDGWEVGHTTRVAVPLALIPFDPARIPKTVLAYLYARHPEIETYCFLVRARRPAARPRRPRPPPRRLAVDFPTMPWKTEAEWREEARRCADDLADLRRSGMGAVARAEAGTVRTIEHVQGALEDTQPMLEALSLDRRRSDEELLRIKSSLTWRAIVKYRTARERLLPSQTRRGRLYERARSAVRRLALGGG
jgi:hypothetical protein